MLNKTETNREYLIIWLNIFIIDKLHPSSKLSEFPVGQYHYQPCKHFSDANPNQTKHGSNTVNAPFRSTQLECKLD